MSFKKRLREIDSCKNDSKFTSHLRTVRVISIFNISHRKLLKCFCIKFKNTLNDLRN
ncbi:hypothetical protein LEP1GSC132_2795 [Leptospira kirschneri str. 200803703]|nr:hypothetical protein LEP1GSC044_3239 [Leptospira kirschneri serovar Grippotyphosa str. RM52]EKP05911.1 hypothetical protein LEP1GSC018_2079 [Leptospira kirschneri str. 2008720114]EKQ83609.1 hypothetical protein LEP1GSC064_2547 [Leptospira kirschneri serovar Grippotyphosa str. Moskva]EMK13039.1 hypothetical protein LEP1GSC042_2742 [Leptospira kirschneri serovar Bim str. PUO 1247]EMN06730.1 hypothetical protein LEP1GSC046_2421 [Leptospira kirschneri serovar Bim str. 1051]EMN24098.1 hypothetic